MKASPPLRIGILGCANIARGFTRHVHTSPSAVIAAVASRNAETAAAFAAQEKIPQHFASYEALLQARDIDTIYIPLPNSMHAEWAIKAAHHGKHVICEKPLAMSLAEARAMFDAARAHGVMLIEAFPYYFQPQTRDMLTLLHSGAIGNVRSVQACFGFTLPSPATNIRSKPELGGGALLDAGSYPISLIRLVMGAAPARVTAQSQWTESGVDISTMATLNYADGRSAQMSCAMNTGVHRHAVIMGSNGTLQTDYLNHNTTQVQSLLRVKRGTSHDTPFEPIHSALGNGFRFCVEAFAQVVAVQDYTAIARAAAASMDNAATLEAIARSAKTGQPIDVQLDH